MANLTKKKEHGPAAPHRFLNSEDWVFRDGVWAAPKLKATCDPCAGVADALNMSAVLFRAEVYDHHPVKINPWDHSYFAQRVYQMVTRPDPYFMRWWIDRFIERVGFEMWNIVYDRARSPERGAARKHDKDATALADAELARWEAQFV